MEYANPLETDREGERVINDDDSCDIHSDKNRNNRLNGYLRRTTAR